MVTALLSPGCPGRRGVGDAIDLGAGAGWVRVRGGGAALQLPPLWLPPFVTLVPAPCSRYNGSYMAIFTRTAAAIFIRPSRSFFLMFS